MGKSKPKVILLPLPPLLSASTRDTRGTNRSLLVSNNQRLDLDARQASSFRVGKDVNIAIGKVYFGLRLIQKAL